VSSLDGTARAAADLQTRIDEQQDIISNLKLEHAAVCNSAHVIPTKVWIRTGAEKCPTLNTVSIQFETRVLEIIVHLHNCTSKVQAVWQYGNVGGATLGPVV